jgi:hypothetical protein
VTRARVSIAVASLVLASCAQSGVLELQLLMPTAPSSSPLFALVQVRRAADHPFAVQWFGDEVDAFELSRTERALAQISVVGSDASGDLHIRVRFCSVPNCDGLGDDNAPEVRYALERPIYTGRRTSWAACIETIPTAMDPAPTTIDRCEIRGCVGGGGSTSYCTMAGTGPHFCETGSADEPPSDLECVGGVALY